MRLNYAFLLRLYPAAWRQRYEEEFRILLEDAPLTIWDACDICVGALDARLRRRPQAQTVGGPTPDLFGGYPMSDPDRLRRALLRVAWLKAFYAHLAAFFLVNLVLLMINLLTTPGNLWVLWPLWGWGMVLAAHAMFTFPWRGTFGADLALMLLLNAGLTAINARYGGGIWFVWPLAACGIVLLAHALVAFDVVGVFGAHVVAYLLGMGELAVLASRTGDGARLVLWAAVTWGTLLAIHALLRAKIVGLFGAHVVAFLAINAELVINNATHRAAGWWFQYPLLVWGSVLLAHALIRFGVIDWYDGAWEAAERERLLTAAGRADPLAPERPHLVAAVRRQARQRRYLRLHLAFYLLAILDLLALNLALSPHEPWVLWPAWGWGIVVAAQAGYALSSRPVLGAHLAVFLTVNAGLLAINLWQGGVYWFYWPLLGWGIVVAGHAILSCNVRRAVGGWEARKVEDLLK